MWSPDRHRLSRRALIGGAAGVCLAGCGFQPLYRIPTSQDAAQGLSAGQALNTIDVAPIADREGQILRNYLVRALNHEGRPIRPSYTLTVTLRETLSRLAIQSDSSATRANLIVDGRYRLIETGGGQLAASGSTRVTTSFNILEDEFATLSAERSARDRALRQMSLNIRSRLSIALIKQDES
ncbi:MAG: LPS assembly lipoprotein LptE [Pseudomonadota bacterium]